MAAIALGCAALVGKRKIRGRETGRSGDREKSNPPDLPISL
jgi:hypothetical protein